MRRGPKPATADGLVLETAADLTEELRPGEVIEVLSAIRFTTASQSRIVALDRGTRDYLIGALRARRGERVL